MKDKNKKKKKGFTLIELLIVVLIIGVLAGMALPMYFRAIEKTRAVKSINLLGTIAKAEQRHKLQNQEYSDQIDNLDITLKNFSEDNEASGSTFDNQYFDFILGTEQAQAVRKNNDYTLYVDYDTNEITCSATNEDDNICERLGLEAGQDYNNPHWEECSGNLTTMWQNRLGVASYESNMTSCNMRTNNRTGKSEFQYCLPSYQHKEVYRIGGSSMSSPGRCFKGYFSDNRIVYTNCGYDDPENCSGANKTNVIFSMDPDGSVWVLNCRSYDYESDTCVNANQGNDSNWYSYINKYLAGNSGYIFVICREMEGNVCVSYTCSHGDCSVVDGRELDY